MDPKGLLIFSWRLCCFSQAFLSLSSLLCSRNALCVSLSRFSPSQPEDSSHSANSAEGLKKHFYLYKRNLLLRMAVIVDFKQHRWDLSKNNNKIDYWRFFISHPPLWQYLWEASKRMNVNYGDTETSPSISQFRVSNSHLKMRVIKLSSIQKRYVKNK